MLVKIVNLTEGRKHNSRLPFPDYRSRGLRAFMHESVREVASAKITGFFLGFLGRSREWPCTNAKLVIT